MYTIMFFLASVLALAEDYKKVDGLDPFISQINGALASQNMKESILHQDVRYNQDKGLVSSIYGTFQVGCAGSRKKLSIIFSEIASTEIDVEKDMLAKGYSGLGLQTFASLLASDQKLQVDSLGFLIRRVRGACRETEGDLYLKVRVWGKPGQPYQATGVKIPRALFEGLK